MQMGVFPFPFCSCGGRVRILYDMDTGDLVYMAKMIFMKPEDRHLAGDMPCYLGGLLLEEGGRECQQSTAWFLLLVISPDRVQSQYVTKTSTFSCEREDNEKAPTTLFGGIGPNLRLSDSGLNFTMYANDYGFIYYALHNMTPNSIHAVTGNFSISAYSSQNRG